MKQRSCGRTAFCYASALCHAEQNLKQIQAFSRQLDQPLLQCRAHVLLSPEQPFQVRGAADAEALDSFAGLAMVKAGLDVSMLGWGELGCGVHCEGSVLPGMGAQQMQEANKAGQRTACRHGQTLVQHKGQDF